MRLRVGAHDETYFRTATNSLLGDFEEWQRRRNIAYEEAARTANEAGLALEWKWAYADGDLGWWRREHLAEFLLEWCPRKLSVSVEDCRTIPRSLAAFVAFSVTSTCSPWGPRLFASSSRPPPSWPTSSWRRWTTRHSSAWPSRCSSPPRPTASTSPTRPSSTRGWPRSTPGRSRRGTASCPPRRWAPSDPSSRRLRYPPTPTSPPPEPRPLSWPCSPSWPLRRNRSSAHPEGQPALADARALVELLGTGDVMEERIGERTFKTRSAADLPRLRQVFAWAKKAGVVRVAHGKVVATKRGLAIGAGPAASFDRAVDALVAIGPLSSRRLHDHWFAWPEVDELLDRLTVHLLAGAYVVQRPVPVQELARGPPTRYSTPSFFRHSTTPTSPAA